MCGAERPTGTVTETATGHRPLRYFFRQPEPPNHDCFSRVNKICKQMNDVFHAFSTLRELLYLNVTCMEWNNIKYILWFAVFNIEMGHHFRERRGRTILWSHERYESCRYGLYFWLIISQRFPEFFYNCGHCVMARHFFGKIRKQFFSQFYSIWIEMLSNEASVRRCDCPVWELSGGPQ